MAPSAVSNEVEQQQQQQQAPEKRQHVTGQIRDAQIRKARVDLPLDVFSYGAHPISGNQDTPVKQVRIPVFENKLDERAFRKLHSAAAQRWMGAHGYHDEGAGGHVTVRDPIRTDCMWINPFCVSMRHMRPEDLVLVDAEGVIQPEGAQHAINPAGFAIHASAYRARPDINAAIHAHSVPSRAFSVMDVELEPISQDACRFYECHGVYRHFGGIVLAREEGDAIARALGKGKACVLRSHGNLTVGKTVDAAAWLFGIFDRCQESQLLAYAACAGYGGGKKPVRVAHEDAVYTRRAYTDEMEYNQFQSSFEEMVRASRGELSFKSGGEKHGYDVYPRDW